jgi:hypothetical protein
MGRIVNARYLHQLPKHRWLAVLLALTACAACRRVSDSQPAQSPRSVLQPAMQAERLVPAALAAGQAQFSKLPVELSGVDFTHQWIPPESYPHDLETTMAGGGVAIGDYDADSWPDI